MKTKQEIYDMAQKVKEALETLTQLTDWMAELSEPTVEQVEDRSKYESDMFAAHYWPSHEKTKPWLVSTRTEKGIFGKRHFGSFKTKEEAINAVDKLTASLNSIGVKNTNTRRVGRKANSNSLKS